MMPDQSMDLKLIRSLVRIMERSELRELLIDDEKAGLKVHLKRGAASDGVATPVVNLIPGAATMPAAGPLPTPPAAAGSGAPAPADHRSGLHEIRSPLVGTFYRRSSPDADPFVAVGQRVDEETVVCIVEAMKVMNEIKAECSGEIVEALVDDGEPVEFGQPLFLVRV